MESKAPSPKAAPPDAAPGSLFEVLATSAERHHDRAAFLTKGDSGWREIRYGDLLKSVNDLRGGLSTLGITPGDRVGLLANNSVEWAVVAFATYGMGAVLVPMYESQREDDWEFIVRDSGIKVLFVSTPALKERARLRLQSIPSLKSVVALTGSDPGPSYATLLAAGERRPAPEVLGCRSDAAVILYTSGTTGDPKGVVLTHGNILSNVETLGGVVMATEKRPEEHRSLSFLPWAHALGHTVELLLLLASGASLAIAESVERIADNIREVKPTVLVAVPRVFIKIHAGVEHIVAAKPAVVRWLFRRGLDAKRSLANGLPPSLGSRLWVLLAEWLVFGRIRARFGGRLKFAISGAASLPREVAEFVDALGISVYEGYGLTETSPIVSANVPGARKLGSAGRPLPGVEVRIQGSADTSSAAGEIVVHGPNVMRGYYRRETETLAALTPEGGLRTGDLGYLDADGYLFITGRIKEQYKLLNGKYVVPSPLEDRLKRSPFIANVMIWGADRPYNVALVVLEPSELSSWAKQQGLADTPASALCEEPRLCQKLADEIAFFSQDFRGYERIRAFALLDQDFTQENQMLTPSLKLRRARVLERYRATLERLYTEGLSAEGPSMPV